MHKFLGWKISNGILQTNWKPKTQVLQGKKKLEKKAWIQGGLKFCSKKQSNHHVLISLEILLLLFSINSPFVHPVESTHWQHLTLLLHSLVAPILCDYTSIDSIWKEVGDYTESSCQTHMILYFINTYHSYLNHIRSVQRFSI